MAFKVVEGTKPLALAGLVEEYLDAGVKWSKRTRDQYEYNLQYAGFSADWDELVVRGSMDERNFVGFYRKDGVVQAAVGVNRGRDVRRAMALIKSRQVVDAKALRDEDVDLRKMAESPAG